MIVIIVRPNHVIAHRQRVDADIVASYLATYRRYEFRMLSSPCRDLILQRVLGDDVRSFRVENRDGRCAVRVSRIPTAVT